MLVYQTRCGVEQTTRATIRTVTSLMELQDSADLIRTDRSASWFLAEIMYMAQCRLSTQSLLMAVCLFPKSRLAKAQTCQTHNTKKFRHTCKDNAIVGLQCIAACLPERTTLFQSTDTVYYLLSDLPTTCHATRATMRRCHQWHLNKYFPTILQTLSKKKWLPNLSSREQMLHNGHG